MRLDELKLDMTTHAYDQYCDRVGKVTWADLRDTCREQLKAKDYSRDGDMIKLNSVWWAFVFADEGLLLVTFYGSGLFDIPKALAWARRNNDRINLNNVVGS